MVRLCMLGNHWEFFGIYIIQKEMLFIFVFVFKLWGLNLFKFHVVDVAAMFKVAIFFKKVLIETRLSSCYDMFLP